MAPLIIALKSLSNGKFICADDATVVTVSGVPGLPDGDKSVLTPGRPLQANRDTVGGWEKMEVWQVMADGSMKPIEVPDGPIDPPDPPDPPDPTDPPIDPPVPPGQFVQSPREWMGNMCGVHVPGLPAIYWGPPDPTLVLSWLYDRYSPSDRASMRAAWKGARATHVMLSWPDARAFDPSPVRFRNMVVELLNDGFHVGVMWCSKDFDPPHVPTILAGIDPAVQQPIGILPVAVIGWELSLWLTPTQVQELIDAIAPRFVAYGCRVGVHFQQGYSSFQQENMFFHHFWDLQVGKLEFTMHQRILGTTPQEYREASGGLQDVLERFAGNFGMQADSGFGHPFDLIAWEITAMNQFDGSVSESEGNTWGTWAMRTPRSTGPAGVVGVIGSGNGVTSEPRAMMAAAAEGQSRIVTPPMTGISKFRLPWRERVGRLVNLNARG